MSKAKWIATGVATLGRGMIDYLIIGIVVAAVCVAMVTVSHD